MRSALNNKSRVKNIKKQNARIPIRLTIKYLCSAVLAHAGTHRETLFLSSPSTLFLSARPFLNARAHSRRMS